MEAANTGSNGKDPVWEFVALRRVLAVSQPAIYRQRLVPISVPENELVQLIWVKIHPARWRFGLERATLRVCMEDTSRLL